MPTTNAGLPDGLIAYGSNENCTLALCPVSASVYGYRPSVPANALFVVLFTIAMFLHLARGVLSKEWSFMVCMVVGSVTELIGYIGRILLHHNPFSFGAFLVQIITITIAPVWYTAAIYVLLARIIQHLGPQYSRFQPKLFYWVFITSDIFSLVLQSLGGALSSTSKGNSNYANDISLVGLSFQVVTLIIFIGLAIDYFVRWRRAEPNAMINRNFKIFLVFLSVAIVLILIRCIYRIDELSDGYDGPLITNQALFIGLESVPVSIAVFLLLVGHPAMAFSGLEKTANKQKTIHDTIDNNNVYDPNGMARV